MTKKDFATNYQNSVIRVTAALGIKELPNQVANEFIIYALKHKYQHLTFQEFELAFTLNACGEWKTVEHFQQFNMDYVGKVLSNYMVSRQTAIQEKPLELPEPIELTPQQRADNNKRLLQTICDDFEAYKLNPLKEILLVDLKYVELEERGIIRLSNEAKNEWVVKAKEIYKKRLINKRGFAKPTELASTNYVLQKVLKGDFPKSEMAEVKTIARELVLKCYFDAWKTEKFNLTEKLNLL